MDRMREWFVSEPQPAARAVVLTAPRVSAPRPSSEGAGSADEKLAYLARVEEAVELVEHGRELSAVVLSRETSERRFNGAQIIVVELEVEDPEDDEHGPRTIVYEHVFGPATARRWKPGRDIRIWIDPRDPERIYAGR
jgi:hypothetical protein